MTNVNLPIGATNSGPNDWSDVHGEDQAIVDVVNGNLTNGNLSGSAGITDANLASPNNVAYKTVSTFGAYASALATGVYAFTTAGTLIANGAGFGSASTTPVPVPILATELAVAGKTTKFRMKMQVHVGPSSPSTVGFALSLGNAGPFGGAFLVVAGTGSVSSSGLSTGSQFVFTGSDTNLPSDGFYAPVLTVSSITVPSAIYVTGQVQVRNT